MLSINDVALCGNLVADPTIKYVGDNQTACAEFTLAVNDRFNKDKTAFIDVTAWRQAAEFTGKYLTKGRRVYVKGSLVQDKWKDKETDGNRSKISVTADRVDAVESPKND